MTLQELKNYHSLFLKHNACFYVEVIHDDIWRDAGVDSATVSVRANNDFWHLHYIRTQSGIPYFLAEYHSTVVDEYTKDFNDEALYDFLALHQQISNFAYYASTIEQKEQE